MSHDAAGFGGDWAGRPRDRGRRDLPKRDALSAFRRVIVPPLILLSLIGIGASIGAILLGVLNDDRPGLLGLPAWLAIGLATIACSATTGLVAWIEVREAARPFRSRGDRWLA